MSSEGGANKLGCRKVVVRGREERRCGRELSSSSSPDPTRLLILYVHRPPQLLLFLFLHGRTQSLERGGGVYPFEVRREGADLLYWRPNEDGGSHRRHRVVSSNRRTGEGSFAERGKSLRLEVGSEFVESSSVAPEPGDEELGGRRGSKSSAWIERNQQPRDEVQTSERRTRFSTENS